MGGRTGRPRKHAQPAGLDDGIYWRPSTKDPSVGTYSVAFRNPTTDKWTTRVIMRDVAKKAARTKKVIDTVNERARAEVAKHTKREKIVAHEVLFRDAWADFLKNKRNRKKQPLKASTRQDYTSIYENYFRGAWSAPNAKPAKKTRKRTTPLSRMTPEQVQALDKTEVERLRKHELGGLADFTLSELAEEWADAEYPMGASRLRRWQGWLDTRAFQGEGMEPDRTERTKLGLISLKRKANILIVMKSFLTHCHKKGWTTENLGKGIEVPVPSEARIRVPSYDKLMELLALLSGQDRVFAELALYSGLRAGELAALTWQSIDYPNEVIFVERSYSHGVMSDTTKGLRSRMVPLHDRITRLLRQWQTVCPSDTMVFPATRMAKNPESGEKGDLVRVAVPGRVMSVDTFRQKVWNPATESVGLKGTRIHDLRHAYITWLASLNVNALLIQTAAGHQDPKTTAAYLGLDPKIYRSIRNAFNAPRTRNGEMLDLSPAERDALATPATEADIDFSWTAAPKEKSAKKATAPEHKPGSGIRVKRAKAPKKPLG